MPDSFTVHPFKPSPQTRRTTPVTGDDADQLTPPPELNPDATPILVPYSRFLERRAWREKIASDFGRLAERLEQIRWSFPKPTQIQAPLGPL